MGRFAAVIVSAVIVVALLGPAAYATVTGRPFIMECHDGLTGKRISDATCNAALDFWTAEFAKGPRHASGLPVAFRLTSVNGTCGDVMVAYGVFFVGEKAQPLC